MGRRLRLREAVALLLLAGSLIASVVVWDHGHVDLGMTVETDTHGMTDPPGIVVGSVIQDGNAARLGINPLWPVVDLTTTDGSEVGRGEPLGVSGGWAPVTPTGSVLVSLFLPQGGELRLIEEDHRPPVEPVEPVRIETALVGFVDGEEETLLILSSIDRSALEEQLAQSIWIVALGLVAGAVVWLLLTRGPSPSVAGRENAFLLASAAALPFVHVPVLQVGTLVGVVAGFLVPLTVALTIGISLARAHPDRRKARAAMIGAAVAALIAGLVILRHMSQTYPEPNVRLAIIGLIGASAFVPAAVAATGIPMPQARSAHLSLALVPAASMTVAAPGPFDPLLAVVLVGLVIGWQLVPIERMVSSAGAVFGPVRSRRFAVEPPREPIVTSLRDTMVYGLLGIAAVTGLMHFDPFWVAVGVGVAALTGFAVRSGFLGSAWTDAAVPLAGALGLPVIAAAYAMWNPFEALSWFIFPVALCAFAVAHVLVAHHSDPAWRPRLLLASAATVLLACAFLLGGSPEAALILAALVALVPGLPTALVDEPGEPRAVSARLDTLAVALTPGIAATALAPAIGPIPLIVWIVAVVVGRQFALAPLIGLAQRTQLQRDLAVAAAETERARLAADLHDDALQQLTMLVRTLDEAGQADAAAQAREVATKLRSVVGDLRLPILDDLGAGAALEWLVERVEPLAGGPVKLERSDATRPPASVELAVFRVAQEALTNAIKHGRPPISVRYDVRTDGRVTLAIDDAGEGIGADDADEAPRLGHFGLANMQQRAEQIGALLDVRRWPAGGTRVALEWRPQ
jgi:signal transduction histidine kinase